MNIIAKYIYPLYIDSVAEGLTPSVFKGFTWHR